MTIWSTCNDCTEAKWASASVDRILREGETQTFETKRVSGKMVGKALETICAFANTRGGWLVLGVEDFNKAKGAVFLGRLKILKP